MFNRKIMDAPQVGALQCQNVGERAEKGVSFLPLFKRVFEFTQVASGVQVELDVASYIGQKNISRPAR
jgi:hypothetical protein